MSLSCTPAVSFLMPCGMQGVSESAQEDPDGLWNDQACRHSLQVPAMKSKHLTDQLCCAGERDRVVLVDSSGAPITVSGPNDSAGAAAAAVERQDRQGKTQQ